MHERKDMRVSLQQKKTKQQVLNTEPVVLIYILGGSLQNIIALGMQCSATFVVSLCYLEINVAALRYIKALYVMLRYHLLKQRLPKSLQVLPKSLQVLLEPSYNFQFRRLCRRLPSVLEKFRLDFHE